MSKTVRLADIARRSRVSATTVSLVLREKPGIPDETRKRVLEAAHALGYRAPSATNTVALPIAPPPDAHALIPGLHNVGLIIKTSQDQTSAVNPFYSYIIAGIEEECRRRRLNLLYASLPVNENNLPIEMPRMLSEEDVEGFLFVGAFLDRTLRHVLESQSVPVVLVDAYSDFSYDSVVSDNVNAAHTAVSYLIEHQHRHIAIVGSRADSYPSVRERREGYFRALREHGITETYFADCPLDAQSATAATLALLQQAPQITALFGCNDEVAIGAVRAVHSMGARVPSDISVIGFDDIDLAQYLVPTLTTMHVDKLGMGRTAVQLLRNRVQHPESEPVTAFLQARLIERESVALNRAVAPA